MPEPSNYEGKGYVFNIQRFSIHDGPGIRTTVFLKGCPLRCGWCSNPESINPLPEIITRDIKCIKCGKCVIACPEGAMEIQDGSRVIHWDRCDECLKCGEVCIPEAIDVMGKSFSVDEVINEVMRDFRFYQGNGGGMTISGGEPLFQWQFTLDLLREAKQRGLHTTIDTSGYTNWDILEKVMEYTDLVMYDIKNMNNAVHQKETKVSNELILHNLEELARRKEIKIWIRCPVIPDFNDSEENFQEMANFILKLGTVVDKVSLLPYHNFGELKYPAGGKIYPYAGRPSPSDENLERLKKILESHQLTVTMKK